MYNGPLHQRYLNRHLTKCQTSGFLDVGLC